jgi:hypothetical protein
MTPQEHMDRDLRLLIGDLMIQLTAARAETAAARDAQAQQQEVVVDSEHPPVKRNGRGVPTDVVNGA